MQNPFQSSPESSQRRRLDLVPIYFGTEGRLVEGLRRELEAAFALPVRLRPPWFDPELAYERSRGQYNSTILLRQLLERRGGKAIKLLAVTSVDLFIPVLTYVFGEAQVDGRAAVVSTHRLRPEAYGLPASEPLVAARLTKEAVHELGHTYGLLHCDLPRCVMHSSTYVEEIDLKSSAFCGNCLEVVRSAR